MKMDDDEDPRSSSAAGSAPASCVVYCTTATTAAYSLLQKTASGKFLTSAGAPTNYNATAAAAATVVAAALPWRSPSAALSTRSADSPITLARSCPVIPRSISACVICGHRRQKRGLGSRAMRRRRDGGALGGLKVLGFPRSSPPGLPACAAVAPVRRRQRRGPAAR